MGVGAGLYMYVVVVQKFTFAISSPDEFLFYVLLFLFLYSIHRMVLILLCFRFVCFSRLLVFAENALILFKILALFLLNLLT